MYYNPLTKEEEFEEFTKEVEQRSGYKRLPSSDKKYMSVPEMGRLLGLKKTGRYWLVHRNFFKMEMVAGKMMVELESFERWYANQVKYHKITGEEPGLELKQRSYSARDIAEMLHITEGLVYEQMNKAGVEYIMVDFWKRYPKEAFDQWYASQDRYRNDEDRAKVQSLYDSTMRMPEMARLLGITRSQVYHLLRTSDILKTIELDNQRRVTKESFYAWYGSQDKYHLVSEKTSKKGKREKNRTLEAYRQMVVDRDGHRKNVGNKDYLTLKEAALLANTESSTIHKWIKTRKIEAIQSSKVIRIPRKEFEAWLQGRRKEKKHGIHS